MAFIPNTTPTPNWLYNGEMKKMNGTELKVIMLVTRKTLGWFDPMTSERKEQDYISQSQFVDFTGQSHTSIAQAIQSSVEHGWIIARNKEGSVCDTPDKRRRRKVWYQLGSVFIDKISSKQETGLDQIDNKNLSNIYAKSKQHFDTNLSKKLDNTKETLTKETLTKNNKINSSNEEFVTSLQKKPNKEINELINYLKNKLQLPELDRHFYQGKNYNRFYAYHLIRKFGLEKSKRLIDIAAADSFWSKQITKFKTLWDNKIRIISNLKQKQEKKGIRL